MADYQYLPVERKEDGSCRNLLPELHLTGLTGREEFLSRDVPLFMPPMIFSRIDTPVEYLYRPDKVMNRSAQKGLDHLPPHLIGTGRQKRTIYTIFKTFDEDTPIGPPEGAEAFLKAKLKNTNLLQLVQTIVFGRLQYLGLHTRAKHFQAGYASIIRAPSEPNICFTCNHSFNKLPHRLDTD